MTGTTTDLTRRPIDELNMLVFGSESAVVTAAMNALHIRALDDHRYEVFADLADVHRRRGASIEEAADYAALGLLTFAKLDPDAMSVLEMRDRYDATGGAR